MTENKASQWRMEFIKFADRETIIYNKEGTLLDLAEYVDEVCEDILVLYCVRLSNKNNEVSA